MKLRQLKRRLPRESLQILRESAIRHQQANQLQHSARCYKKILSHTPKDTEILNDLGTIYYLQGNYKTAASYYKKAIILNPDMSQAHYNLGNTHNIDHQPEQALACYLTAIMLDPSNLDAINNIGNIHYDQGNIEEAIHYFYKALELTPDNHQIRSIIVSSQNYIPDITPAYQLELATQWWEHHGKPLYRKTLYRSLPDLDRALKVGFISPDFREHSIAYFFTPLITHLNQEKLETTCYSDTAHPDTITKKIQHQTKHWRQTSKLTDAQLTRQIEQDGIDILVDLTGHMHNNRLLVFARQPAPVQLSWLGYPNTSGLPTIQYRLTDAIADPPGLTDKFYTEKLLRMPKGFLCYTPPIDCPPIRERKRQKNAITFASFNNPAKMNDKTIKIWATILKNLPHATLLLKGKLLDNPHTREAFTQKFCQFGGNPQQIGYLPFTRSTQEHLLLYNKVDICLDPFPYNGTTTTCEALWMGVPVITLLGAQHAARVGASILTIIGMDNLIAHSEEKYIEIACKLSQDSEQLRQWRTNLRNQLQDSSLCDAQGFAREIELIFRHIWHEWCETQAK